MRGWVIAGGVVLVAFGIASRRSKDYGNVRRYVFIVVGILLIVGAVLTGLQFPYLGA